MAGFGDQARAAALRGGTVFFLLTAALCAACSSDGVRRSAAALQVAQDVQFGDVSVGRRHVAQLQLQNVGRTSLHLTGIHLERPTPEDFTVTGADDHTLGSSETLTLMVSFGPTSVGARAARLIIPTDSLETPETVVSLWGSGVRGEAALAQNSLDFGKVELNTTATLQLDFKNTSDTPADVNIPNVTGDDASAFRTGSSGWLTLAPRTAQSVPVTFVPSRLGPHGAHLLVQTCPSCAAQDVSLSGEGIAATLVASPTLLDFGHVAPASSRMLEVTLTNVGSQAVQMTTVGFGQGTSKDFTADTLPVGGVILAPNGSRVFRVTFAPTTLAAQNGMLRIQTLDPATPVVVIPLIGASGGPQIQVTPPSLGFPRTGVGIDVQKNVAIHNVGTDPTSMDPLVITSITVQGGEFVWSLPTGRTLPATVGAGRSLQVNVDYTALQAHSSTGTLTISSSDSTGHAFPDVTVPLTASAADLGPCAYDVTPAQLAFGSVATGQQASLAFAVRNRGTNDCVIANVRLSLSTSATFAVSPFSSRMIPAGGEYLVPVDFQPDSEAAFAGAVLFDVSSPTAPQATVPLTGTGVNPCLQISPSTLLFGEVGLQCRPPTLQVIVRNACSLPVLVSRANVDGGANGAFSLSSGLIAPVALLPGGQVNLGVTYSPHVEGHDLGALYIQAGSAPDPYLVTLDGTAQTMPTQTDTFTEAPVSKVDFLFVMDNSGSMADKQGNIAANVGAFLQAMQAQNIDFHIAVTTTGLAPYDSGWATCPGGAHGGEDGRFFPTDNSRPRILTNTTPDLANMFAQNMKVGICHWWEEGLEGARLALTSPLVDHAKDPNTTDPNDGNLGFLRSDARLYVFYISDADDSDTYPLQMYIDQLHSLKPGHPELVSASAAIGLPTCNHIESIGYRYMQVVKAFGGIIADICTSDWGGTLGQIAQDAASPSSVFPLSQPADASQLVVSVDASAVPPADAAGTVHWRFDPSVGLHGAVVFDPAYAPMPGQVITVTYSVPCP
jgi:hypothetical protein